MSVIEVRHLKKSFGSKLVHRDVSFVVNKGECLGLIGSSGVGKSVILRSLIGLDRPDSGEVIVDGKDICRFSERELAEVRTNIAFVFQGGALFDSMTVFDNLAYPLREHTSIGESEIDARVKKSLEDFGLAGAASLFPASLSGGMQKRVGLARAVILRPAVILYDEPTAGLDPYNTRRIQEMIRNMRAKCKSAILVTHDIPSAMATCDRIALLHEGRIESVQEVSEMKSRMAEPIRRFIEGEFD